MKYCFNKNQIEKSFDYLFNNKTDNSEVVQIIENSKLWTDKIIYINYLVTQIIQKKIKKNKLSQNFVEEFYSLKDVGDIVIAEIDDDFIDFLFKHKSISTEMNENLIYFKEKYIDYDWGVNLLINLYLKIHPIFEI